MNPIRQINYSEPPDCEAKAKEIWGNVPAFCRFILISTVSIFLFSFINPMVPYYLHNQPFLIIYYDQYWRILTGPFAHIKFIQILFSLLSYLPTAYQLEKHEGTVKMTFRFILNTILIESLFVILCYTMAKTFLDPLFLIRFSIGLWPILFCNITTQCNQDPDVPVRLCFLPIKIKQKFFPWALLAFIAVIVRFRFDLFVGMAVGYLHVYKALDYFEISIQKAKVWEKRFPFKYFATTSYFITADGSVGLLTFARPTNSNGRELQQTQVQATFQPFQGRGVALGGISQNSISSSIASNQEISPMSVLGQPTIINDQGRMDLGPNEIDDSIGYAIDKKRKDNQQYQQVSNNTDEGEDEESKINQK